MHGVAEFDGLAQPRQSIRSQCIHLAGFRLVAAVVHESAVAIRVVAVIGHVAADVRHHDVHRAAAIDLDFLGQDGLYVLAVKAAGMRVHVHEYSRLVNLEDTLVRERRRRLRGFG